MSQQNKTQPPLNNQAPSDDETTCLQVVRKGSNYALVTLKIRGDRVLSRTVGEESMKAQVLANASSFWAKNCSLS